jgi:hypothetical protein
MGCDTASVGYREARTFIKTTRANEVAPGVRKPRRRFRDRAIVRVVRDRVLPSARLVAAAASVIIVAAGHAGAAEPPELESLVAGASSCPRPDLVLAELATLLPPDRLAARLRALPGAPAVVELVDRGVPFQVIIAGRVREYRDEARDCVHRARVAAVFVALTIDPAFVAAAAPPPVAPPPVAPPPPPPTVVEPMPAPATPPRARVDVAAAIDAGVGSADRVAQAGAALRLTIGRGRLAFVAGAIALWPVDTTVGGVRLHQWRLPFDAGVRVNLAGRNLAPYAEAGLCAAVLTETALDLATANSRTAVEIGARAAFGVRAGASRFAPFAALHVELIPYPAEIYALPQGVAGRTPHLWLGASAGASIGFLP